MNDIRRWMDVCDQLVEGRLPSRIFHGTNPIAAAAILLKDHLRATEPVDDDGIGAVVCVTSRARVARMFAIEFARANSDFDVGVVFILDGAKVKADIDAVRHRAETQGAHEEFEYRIQGDIRPLSKYLLGVRLVGKTRLLSSERFREGLWHAYRTNEAYYGWTFGSESVFWAALDRVIAAARQR